MSSVLVFSNNRSLPSFKALDIPLLDNAYRSATGVHGRRSGALLVYDDARVAVAAHCVGRRFCAIAFLGENGLASNEEMRDTIDNKRGLVLSIGGIERNRAEAVHGGNEVDLSCSTANEKVLTEWFRCNTPSAVPQRVRGIGKNWKGKLRQLNGDGDGA